MTNPQTQRRRIFKSGVVVLMLGALLSITGLVNAPARAAEKVTICHRTDSVTNPYRLVSVDLSATQGPDHATHTGPVFDPAINTSNQIPWGDVIPGVLNWDDAGQAFYNADCQLPDEPADPPVCEFDPDLNADDSGCVAPVDVCADVAGVQTDPADCPAPVDLCPGLDGDQASVADCPPVVVQDTAVTPTPLPVVQDNAVTPTPTPAPTPQVVQVVQVEGVQLTATPAAPVAPTQAVAAQLPRTGTDSLPLAELGLGLVFLGAGALIYGRGRTVTV